ncbi:MAG: hypothetical protein AAGG50_00975 [Bacteroidota bacterium]
MPHKDEPLGPVAELAAGAVAEVRAEVTGDEEAMLAAWEQGVEPEAIEATQIGAIVTATLLAVVVLIVTGVWLTTGSVQVAQGVSEDVSEYAELRDLRAAAIDKIGDEAWGVVSEEDDIYRIPVAEAMAVVAQRYEEQQAGNSVYVEPPSFWSTQDLIKRDAVVAQQPGTVVATAPTAPASVPDINEAVTPLGPDELTADTP